VPSPGSGYAWDLHHALGEVALLPAPEWLIPPEPQREPAKPVERADGLSPYAEAAVNSACRNIARAPNGCQEEILTGEARSIGRLAGAGAVPEGWALRMLLRAAHRIPDYDRKRPWKAKDIEKRSMTPSTAASASRGRCAMAEGNGVGNGATHNGTGNGFANGHGFDIDPGETERLRQKYRQSKKNLPHLARSPLKSVHPRLIHAACGRLLHVAHGQAFFSASTHA
jgi:hypothetical protein